jgi:tetratricopeptide (TPR) repeat protein
MPEKSLPEIPRDVREQFDKGMQAFQRDNLDYAIQFFTFALTREPGFFEARKALRATQFKKSQAKGGFFKKMLSTATSSPLVAKAQVQLRTNPAEAINTCEQILNGDPNNVSAHKMLAEAAMAAELYKTAILSLEIVLKSNPRDKEVSLNLADALAADGQVPRAEQILGELARAYPGDGDVASRLKNFSARRTMTEGNYEKATEGGSFRDMLKNKEEAISLEQEKREVKSEDVALRLINENLARLAQEPGNLRIIRSLAELYAARKEYDKAMEFYQKIAESGTADATLEKAITQTALKKFDAALEKLDATDPANAAAIETIKAERATFLLADTQRRAAKYPTDLEIRFELGRLFFETGKISEAIQEFQKAQSNPHRRLASMGFLAQCFFKRGMNDLAARKLQEAIREKPVFDEEKKDLVYNLGLVLEKMGKREEAIEQFKLIYESDIGYKDVSAKVDAYYSGN